MRKQDVRKLRNAIATACNMMTEELEQRRLLAVAFNNGDMYISGTAGADTIVVDYDGNGNVQASINGAAAVGFVGVTRVFIEGLADNDSIDASAISNPPVSTEMQAMT